MKRTVATLILGLLTLPSFAKDKPKIDWLDKTDTANLVCRDFIKNHAKDPASIVLDDGYQRQFGDGFFRNWVYITVGGMGRNTFGAVLRHSWTCEFKCRADSPCSIQSVSESE